MRTSNAETGGSSSRSEPRRFVSGIALSKSLLLVTLLAGCNETTGVTQEPTQGPETVAASTKSERNLAGHRVEVAVVEPSDRYLRISAPGEVQGFRDAALAAPLGGYIEHVSVKQGDRVKKGQVLLSVDQATHTARLARGKVELESAERELGRAESLSGTIPRAEIDTARDRVNAARAAAKELILNASRSLVRAPFAGYVVRIDAEVGEVAPPGAVLMRIVQLHPAKVTVAIADRDIALAKKGSKAKIELDARAGTFDGVVTEISRAADAKTRSFEAVIEVPNEDERLLPGMIANVTLETATASESTPTPNVDDATREAKSDDQLIISQDWLVTSREGVGVFVEEGGIAKWRAVELGEVLRTQVVVKRGLDAGDALVIVGHRDLKDGDRVLVHRRGRCCTEGRVSFAD